MELREILMITSVLKDVKKKKTDEQPDGKLSEPHTFGIFMGASSHRRDQLLTPFPTPLPSLGKGAGAENSKLLIISWSFQRPAAFQKPSRTPPTVNSIEQKMLLSALIP